MKTDIPGFEIIPRKVSGLLSQFISMGWKWYSPFGLYGQAYQVSAARPEIEEFLVKKFMRFGKSWDRRTRSSPNHHLWITAWRQRGKIRGLERDAANRQAEILAYYVDTRKHRSWFQRALLRFLFGFRGPAADPGPDWEDKET